MLVIRLKQGSPIEEEAARIYKKFNADKELRDKTIEENYGVKPDGFSREFDANVTGLYDYTRIGFYKEMPKGSGLLKKKKEGDFYVYAVDKRSAKGKKVIEVFRTFGASGDRLQELGIPLCYSIDHGTSYSDFNIGKDEKGYFIRVNDGCLNRLPKNPDFWVEVKE